MSEDGPSQPRLAAALGYLTATRLLVNTLHRFVFPFLPAIARGLGISLGQAGLLISARNLAGAAAPLTVGVGSRGGGRRVVTSGLVLLVVGAALASVSAGLIAALVAFVFLGLGKPTFDVGQQTYLSDRTPYHLRARYLSTVELTWAGGLLLGGPAAGWLISRFGWQAPFVAVGVGLAVALALVARVLAPGPSRPPGRRATLQLEPAARSLLGVALLFSLATELVFIVFGAWLEEDFGLSLIGLGGVATVIGLAELAGEGTTIAFTDRLGKRRAVAVGLVISIVSFAALGAASGRFAVGIALLAIGLFGFEITIVSTIPLASEVDPADRSRYLALLVFAVSIGRAAGAGLGPWLFERGGFATNTIVAAALLVVALATLLRWVPEPDHPRPE